MFWTLFYLHTAWNLASLAYLLLYGLVLVPLAFLWCLVRSSFRSGGFGSEFRRGWAEERARRR